MDVRTLTTMGQTLQDRVRRFFETPLEADAAPLEIAQAVLDAVERHVQPVGRGRRIFPYRTLRVTVRADEARHAALETALADMAVRVRERLAEVRCEPPGELDVVLCCVVDAPASWSPGQVFALEYVPARVSHEGRARAVPCPVLTVTVVTGTAAHPEFSFTGPVVAIGRSTDPTDETGRVRRNRLAFDDVVDGVNETVGRAHARLRFDPDTAAYRIFDEGSRNGTSVVRDGEVIAVHAHDPRGVRIRSGDEVRVGRAVLRITVEER